MSNRRLDLLFLGRTDGLNMVGLGPSRQLGPSRPDTLRPTSSSSTRPNPSPKSSRSNSSGSESSLGDVFDRPQNRRDSESSTASSTALTTAPSLNGPLPWHIHVANNTHNLPINPIVYSYDLPCECAFIGCNVRFSAPEVEEWISHSISHFGAAGPPVLSICTFCDSANAIFENLDDPHRSWRQRMLHIRDHFAGNAGEDRLRPDFWVIDHMRINNQISLEDYNQIMQYTERPKCEFLVPRGYQTDEMKYKVERSLEQRHDLQKERREMRKRKK